MGCSAKSDCDCVKITRLGLSLQMGKSDAYHITQLALCVCKTSPLSSVSHTIIFSAPDLNFSQKYLGSLCTTLQQSVLSRGYKEPVTLRQKWEEVISPTLVSWGKGEWRRWINIFHKTVLSGSCIQQNIEFLQSALKCNFVSVVLLVSAIFWQK